MRSKTFFALLFPVCISCYSKSENPEAVTIAVEAAVRPNDDLNPYPNIAAIPLPAGFKKLAHENDGFAAWLQQVNLKRDKMVYLFNGNKKINQTAQFAVLDISTGEQD